MPVNPPPILVKIGGRDKLSRVLNTVSAKLNKFGRRATMAGRTVSSRLSLPLVLVGGVAIAAAGNFEASMKTIEGVVGDVGVPALTAMSDTAKELGATTQFSASQAAQGMTALAKVGLGTKQVIDAVAPSLELAAAEETELGEAAAMVAFNLKRFNLEATEANRIAQVLSATASRSGTDILSMEESMTKLGPVLGKMGFQIEEVSTLIGLLGDGGIIGSQAGAALATSFARLAKPSGEVAQAMDFFKISLFDANGEVKPMAKFVDELKNKLGPLDSKTRSAAISTIFGARALAQWTTIIDAGGKGFTTLEDKITGTTLATDKATLKMAGFNGAMKALKSALEAVAIAIGESGVLEFLTKVAMKLADVFRNLSKTNPAFLRIGFVVAAVAAAIGPLLIVIGFVAQGIAALVPLLKIITAVQWLWNAALTANPIGLIIVGVAALTLGIIKLVKHWDKIIAKFTAGWGIIRKVRGFLFGGGEKAKTVAEWEKEMGAGVGARDTGNRIQEIRRETTTKGEATVNVNFSNTPKGTRVDTENEGVDLNQNLGFQG